MLQSGSRTSLKTWISSPMIDVDARTNAPPTWAVTSSSLNATPRTTTASVPHCTLHPATRREESNPDETVYLKEIASHLIVLHDDLKLCHKRRAMHALVPRSVSVSVRVRSSLIRWPLLEFQGECGSGVRDGVREDGGAGGGTTEVYSEGGGGELPEVARWLFCSDFKRDATA